MVSDLPNIPPMLAIHTRQNIKITFGSSNIPSQIERKWIECEKSQGHSHKKSVKVTSSLRSYPRSTFIGKYACKTAKFLLCKPVAVVIGFFSNNWANEVDTPYNNSEHAGGQSHWAKLAYFAGIFDRHLSCSSLQMVAFS